jgi:hypothetical protein
MSKEDLSIREFCIQNNIPDGFQSNRIRAGRNSAVYKISYNKSSWILKHYFSHSSQSKSRLLTEYHFLEFLSDANISNVASPIAMDKKNQLALYTFLPGKIPSEISLFHIDEATDFILKLYSLKDNANAALIDRAVDSCYTLNEHIDLVDMRIRELSGSCDHSPEFTEWFNGTLVPTWQNIKSQIAQNDIFEKSEILTISPSDFGFHNALDCDCRLSFVDFEYAGWDSLSKLACDFICQPEVPISNEQANYFLEMMAKEISSPEFNNRIKFLLPLHRIKWCCIMLNVFKSTGRLKFAHSGVVASDILNIQLNKAKSYFLMHLNQFQ